MDDIDKAIINHLQDGFPICDAPYRVVSERLGIDEKTLIGHLKSLLEQGLMTRFGPLFHAERMGGALTLAAVMAPEDRFDRIADIINAFPEVAHNYAREHALNMWFVIATETPERIETVIGEIERQTGLKVYNMPKIEEYYVGLRFEA